MAIQFSCPGCGKGFQVPEELGGTRLRCKGCSTMLTVPLDAEIVDDEPSSAKDAAPSGERASPAADDDAPIVAEVVRPSRERGRRKKRSALKIILILGLLAGLFTCLVGGGGTAVWYFAIRDPGLAGDLKYMPDNFTRLHAVNYDDLKAAPAYSKAQTCPGAKNRFAFLRTPDGKTPDVIRAMTGGNASETVTVLTLRNEATIQDMIDAKTKVTESTIEGKKVYEAGQTVYLIVGKRVVITSPPTLQRVLRRGGKPSLNDAMRDVVKEIDYSRPEISVLDWTLELHQIRDLIAAMGHEMPLAMVQEFDYQTPMNTNTRFVCRDEKAAEVFANNAVNGSMWRGKTKVISVRRKKALVTVEGQADDPCDALGPPVPPNPFAP